MRGNRTGKGWFAKGQSGNPGGRLKDPLKHSMPSPGYAPDPTVAERRPDPTVADRRPISNLVVEARRYSALAVDTLVELTKDSHTDSTSSERGFTPDRRGNYGTVV
jgi:hypothetical protein